MLRALLTLSLLLSVLPARAQFGTAPVQPTDLYRLAHLGDVALSPDGRFAAYTVRTIEDNDDGPSYRTRIYLVPTDGSAPPRPLTSAERNASQPTWHPDAQQLAFVRATDGKPQVFTLSLLGGEAQQLTDAEHGARSPRFSPNGERLLYTSSLPQSALSGTPPWPTERPGRYRAAGTANPDGNLAEIRAWLADNAAEENPRVLTRLNLQGENDLAPELSFSHLYVRDLATGDTRRITDGFFDHNGSEWLDDNTLLFAAHRDARTHPDRVLTADLWRVDTDGRRMQRYITLGGHRLSNPTPSPDGLHIAFTASALDTPSYAQTRLGVWSVEGDSLVFFSDDFDRSVRSLAWSESGWHVYFTAASDGGFPLYRVRLFDAPEDESIAEEETVVAPADSFGVASLLSSTDSTAAVADTVDVEIDAPGSLLQIERLTEFDAGVHAFDVGEGNVVFVQTEVANPSELYTATLGLSGPLQLTEHNADWLRDKRLSFPRKYQLTNDSLTIDYWVMRPPDFDSRRQYPLLLEIHGGPSSMWGPGETSMWHEFQMMAAKGFVVVYANPRGSGGYGFNFQRANYRDWGHGPASDVLAAAAAVAEEPWVDADRQVVTGGSYAGYLTAWIVAHDDRFRAAVAQRGVYDLSVFLGEGRAWRLVPNHFGGYPWQPEVDSVLTANSPLTFVENINTPLLIIHGDEDLRTGVIQSEQLYKALKLLNKPVEYVRYPDSGHELSRSGNPKQRIDRLLRIYEFLARFLDIPRSTAAGG